MNVNHNGHHNSWGTVHGRNNARFVRIQFLIFSTIAIVVIVCVRHFVQSTASQRQQRITTASSQYVKSSEFILSSTKNEQRLSQMYDVQKTSKINRGNSLSNNGGSSATSDSDSNSGSEDIEEQQEEQQQNERAHPDLSSFTLTKEENDARLDEIAAIRNKTRFEAAQKNLTKWLRLSNDTEPIIQQAGREDGIDSSHEKHNDGHQVREDGIESSHEKHNDDDSTTENDSEEEKSTTESNSASVARKESDLELITKDSSEKLSLKKLNSKDNSDVDEEKSDKEDDEGEKDDTEDNEEKKGYKEDDEGNGDAESGDSGDKEVPLCTRQQIIDGKWVKDVLKKPPYIVSTVHLRCYPHEAYYDKKGWKTWKWQPVAKRIGKCTFESYFQKDDFCRLLPQGVVSIVGDSLSWEHYRSLIQLTGTKTHQSYQHQSRELNTNIFQSVCNGRTKVLYRRDDMLQNVTGSIQQNFPVVLVMNRGAHYVPDEELMPDIRKNIKELQEHWIPKCIENKIKCHLLWRTAVPGHPFCYETKKSEVKGGKPIYVPTYKEPINDLAYWENLIGNMSIYNNRSITFHWYDYQHQNKLVLAEFDKAFGELSSTSPYFRYEVIDAYYLNIRRPDEHRAHQADCLHNCYPSKMDVYSILMLHYLKQQRTERDIENLQRTVRENHLWRVDDTTPFDPDATALAKKARLEAEAAAAAAAAAEAGTTDTDKN